ncbi:TldD/PmbA family protein [Candidatus Hakubella thermalkaliphila]|uniref:TldD protein n=2 Tax=Candidatus Hakubella thermalkaliphila TaxID=2754717 RepID=A0A6V8P321_9ACTN|nr:TldD/PmbA family protein [Candidatus Hakubella thermalkaliphila]GFP26955.1 TldD protein [Candidatus Hakubella thermalkaliphila]
MISDSTTKKALARALRSGGDFAEIYVEDRASNSLRLEDSKIERASSGREVGAGIRLRVEERTFYAYTNDLTEKGLLATADTLQAALDSSSLTKTLNLKAREARSCRGQDTIMPQEVPQEDKVALLRKTDQAARQVSHEVIQVIAWYSDEIQKVLIANSRGLLVEDERIRTRFIIYVIARRKEIIQTGYKPLAYLQGYEALDQHPPQEAAITAARAAVTMLDAIAAPSGRMPVVIAKGSGGTIFHEACGHGLEADHIYKNASVYAGKRGQRVAAEIVTAMDDSTLKNSWGSFGFDDEGNPAQSTLLIEQGILRNYLYDDYWAERMGERATGNGRRQSYQHLPIPRMTNTYICKGQDDPLDIIRATEKGFFAQTLSGGQVDPATGDFVFGVSEGYLIERGEISTPVRGATLIGNGPRILFEIDMIGNDLEISPGTCGKEGQGIPDGSGCPTLRVRELTVGGTQGGI